MTRIESKFRELLDAGKKAFIPFVTAGDPGLDQTYELVLALESAGADVIELGVPFSDPIADGPVIQRATERALRAGTSIGDVLKLAARIRKTSEIPLVLFSYFNPLMSQGVRTIAERAADAGIDGILATDLTVEEASDYLEALEANNLNSIFLAAPTSSEERIRKIAAVSGGFLYALSRTGVTGEQNELSSELVDFIRLLRSLTASPIAVGFGISHPDHVRKVWAEADGAIVGSAIVREIEKRIDDDDMPARVGEFVRWLRGA